MNRDVFIHVMLVSFVFLGLNFLAAVVLQHLDGLTYTDGFYLAMSASVTSGYGNVAATSDGAKWFISFYQIIGFGLLFYLYSVSIVSHTEKYNLLTVSKNNKIGRL